MIFSTFLSLVTEPKFSNGKLDGKESPFTALPYNRRFKKSFMLKFRVRRPIVSWSVHGLTMLAVPEHYILLDITINMDIQSQPGPETALTEESKMRAAFGMKYLSNMGKQARCASFERLKLINSRISEVIKENRRYPVAVMGSREWWKKVDSTSQRRNSTIVNLDNNSLDRLNDYFG